MIFTDYTKFEEYIPTAAGSDVDEMKTYLAEAEHWLRDTVLGTDLYAYIEGNLTANERKSCELAICLKAYREAIPFVDLIQTPNGFAVVRNANQAPASKERVEALLKQTVRRLSETVDSLLYNILYIYPELHPEWVKSDVSKELCEVVFLTARALRANTGNKDALRDDLIAMRADLLRLQEDCARHFSNEYMSVLLERFRMNILSESDKSMLHGIRTIIGLMIQQKEYYKLIEYHVNYMIANLSSFPEYAASAVYQVKIGEKYENRRRDSTFFFNG